MLVLSRKEGESIVVGGDIRITVIRIKGTAVRVGIEAPSHTGIMRSEIEFDSSSNPDANRDHEHPGSDWPQGLHRAAAKTGL